MVQTEDDEQLFVNTFGNTRHKKTTLGNQQLYIIDIRYLFPVSNSGTSIFDYRFLRS